MEEGDCEVSIASKIESLDLNGEKEEAVSKNETINATFNHTSFRQVHREIKYFCKDGDASELTFSPMDPQERRYLQELAHCYDLYIESQGPWESRYCVIRKTKTKHIAKSISKIDSIIESADNYVKYVSSKRKVNYAKVSKTKTAKNKASITTLSGKPLDESNAGHGLLVKMGWSPGQGLGTDNDGDIDPIAAQVRRSKAGIGS